jgi:hypothetical protein
MSRRVSSNDRFARIPERFTRRLERGEVSFDGYGIMVFLVARCDPKTSEWVGTLVVLQDGLRWKRTPQHLRDELRRLKRLGEIDFDVKQGQRDPWVIGVTGASFGLPDFKPTSNERGGSGLKLTSNDPETETGENDGANVDREQPRLQTTRESREPDSDTDSPPNPLVNEGDDDDDELLRFLKCRCCGKPATAGERCASCDAPPRDAGTSPRAVAKTLSRFAGARNLVVRFWDDYDEDAIRAELATAKVPDELADELIRQEHARRGIPAGTREGQA